MNTKPKPQHPFAKVDLAQLDEEFLGLVGQAITEDVTITGRLSRREKRLFQFGLLVGHGEWDLAAECIEELQTEGMAQQTFIEAALIRGSLVLAHLGPSFNRRGLHAPASMIEIAKAIRTFRGKDSSLTFRESFALGLGITWGARCWET